MVFVDDLVRGHFDCQEAPSTGSGQVLRMNVFAKVGPTRFAIGRGRFFHTYISRNFAFFVVNLFPFLDSSDLKLQYGDLQIQRNPSSQSSLLSSAFSPPLIINRPTMSSGFA